MIQSLSIGVSEKFICNYIKQNKIKLPYNYVLKANCFWPFGLTVCI